MGEGRPRSDADLGSPGSRCAAHSQGELLTNRVLLATRLSAESRGVDALALRIAAERRAHLVIIVIDRRARSRALEAGRRLAELTGEAEQRLITYDIEDASGCPVALVTGVARSGRESGLIVGDGHSAAWFRPDGLQMR